MLCHSVDNIVLHNGKLQFRIQMSDISSKFQTIYIATGIEYTPIQMNSNWFIFSDIHRQNKLVINSTEAYHIYREISIDAIYQMYPFHID